RYTARLVLAYDGDAAGLTATLRNAPMFEEAGCDVRVVRLPAGRGPGPVIAEGGGPAVQGPVGGAGPHPRLPPGPVRPTGELRHEAQRAQMVREASALIARMPSSITREQYGGKLDALIARLAAQWHPTDVGRSRSAEAAIRSEIRSKLRQAPRQPLAGGGRWRRPEGAAEAAPE